jgi:hypothetical protein
MQYLNEPVYRKEGNVFVLYKGNFTTDEEHASPHTSVAGGNGLEMRRFSTLAELQQYSRESFGKEAREIAA